MNNEEKKQLLFAYKVKNDFKWYSKNFLKIRDKKSHLINFSLNDAQLVFLDQIEKDKKAGKPLRYIILKARQLGFSTFTEGYIYWDTSTNEYKNSLIIAHEDKATQNLFAMSKLFYDESPSAIQPMKKYSNEKALVFENPTTSPEEKQTNPGLRSKITVATAGTSDTARSGTYHNVHVSEIAFFPNPKNTMTALLQCVPDEPNTMVVMESTANGVGGYFYDMWNDAVEGKNDFVPLFFPWYTDKNYTKEFESEEQREAFKEQIETPDKDSSGNTIYSEEYILYNDIGLTLEQLNWRRATIGNKCGGDLEMFHQEYPSTPEEAFIASGRPKFDVNALKEYKRVCTKPKEVCEILKENGKVKVIPAVKGRFQIWKTPNPNYRYYIGADVAEGLEKGDYSVAIVMDNNLDVVAKWRGHIDPDLFGDVLTNLGDYYNEAYLVPENNNHGLTTIKKIIQNEYYAIYKTKLYDRINDSFTQKLGWSTTNKTKPLMIDKLAEYIREKYLLIHDEEIVSELFTYVIDDRGRTNAQQGKHDDCVMSLGMALQGVLEDYGNEYIPEIPDEKTYKKSNDDFDAVPEIIDPEFEEEETEEYEK